MADHRPPGESEPPRKVSVPRSARRNLFGRDPNVPFDDLAKEREELSRRQESNFKEQWNFDIVNDTPLSGRYEWMESIPLTTSAPLLHVPNTNLNNSNSSTSDQNVPPTRTISTSSNGCRTSTSSSDSNGVCRDLPPPKRQRSSDSEDLNSSSPQPKSPKR